MGDQQERTSRTGRACECQDAPASDGKEERAARQARCFSVASGALSSGGSFKDFCVGNGPRAPRPAHDRDAREASARDEALAASDEARVPGARDPLEASVRRGWRESSKRSSASVGADAPFRGKGIASPDQPREPKQSWRPQGPTGLDVRDHDRGTEFAESRFRASRVTFVRRQRPYRRSPRSRSSGCCSARAKRSSHRCRDKRCSVSGHENPSGRNRRSGRVLAAHRAQGILVVENVVGHAVCGRWAESPCFSVAAPAICPGALRARIGLCRSPTRSPSS